MDALFSGQLDNMETAGSESSASPPLPDPAASHTKPMYLPRCQTQAQGQKRTCAEAGLKPTGQRPGKSVKRRASKACQCCRARKVRCNVVEHGAPCTNCRLDEIECIVSESKRKTKLTTDETSPELSSCQLPKPRSTFPTSAHPPYSTSEHVPHALYQDVNKQMISNSQSNPSPYSPNTLYAFQRLGLKLGTVAESLPLMADLTSPISPSQPLPLYIKPLPARFGPEEVSYLESKGALSIPDVPFRNELLRCYAEYVHPFMPLLSIFQFVRTIDQNDGKSTISLLLFQSVMFSAIATVDMRHLKAAGYTTRRDARREFFQKTRLLYDFDYEIDRISLIQSLLLMTYWYETPDDQKDSHHWMGIAVSLSHTIGLHRNQEKSSAIDPARQKLWKRIWWSTYMRDRLIALGMRRPTRIKNADFDVEMLTPDDFESDLLSDGPSCMPPECKLLRDTAKQRQLAIMCIEKTKLCICISNVLCVQYSVLHNNHGILTEEGSTRTTMMLVAKKLDPEVDQLRKCDQELQDWKDNLAEEAQYVVPTWDNVESGEGYMALNISLLHMIYYATLSALHRPQVLPSTTMPARNTQSDVVEVSRHAVREAASNITEIADTLYRLGLARYLPTTGITVLLPAIIIHLLDVKAPDLATRMSSLQGFSQCMEIMAELRDIYAAADYSTAFLEAAIRKAEIVIPNPQKMEGNRDRGNVITSAQGLIDIGKRMQLSACGTRSSALTPPPDEIASGPSISGQLTEDDIARRLNSYLASTPPGSEHHNSNDSVDAHGAIAIAIQHDVDFELDFDNLVNIDAAGEMFSLNDGAYGAMRGESSGFAMDVDWMKGINSDGLSGPARNAVFVET